MEQSLYILDGGLGSDLFINGGYDKTTLNNDPLWLSRITYENPNAIKESHKRFISAGCDVITTGSYQASVKGFVEYAGVSTNKAEEIITSSVDIAKNAVAECNLNRKVLIAGSISPYGAVLHDMSEYSGAYINNVTDKDLRDFHQTNIRLLASKGIDLFAFETLPALKEAVVLADMLKQYPNIKAWVSFTTTDGIHTSYGDPFTKVFQDLSRYPQVVAIGSNCCDAKYTYPMLEAAKTHLASHQKCIIYPDNRNTATTNSSLPWLDEINGWLDTRVVQWIGGCCQTTPDNIKQIHTVVRKWESNAK